MNTEIEKGVQFLRSNDPVLRQVIELSGPCTLRPSKTYFKDLVSSIISQQLSVIAADSIYRRLEEACGSAITPENILKLETEELRALGLSYQKAGYLHSLAAYFQNNKAEIENLDALADKDVVSSLCKIKGIGEWTAHMFLIFSLNRLDVLPLGDVGFKRSFAIQYQVDRYKHIDEHIISASKKWGNYRSIAAWYLWRILDN